ncbi:MAG: potassium transporter Kef [Gammaproteobacteria bacterium]|nr:potassium transporter Kef [Gammaproteobacteria bacterium]
MNYEWIAIAPSDLASLVLAFVLGFLSRTVGLPPLVGFLAAGFILAAAGIADNPLVQGLSDLGITLLLFTVGLKINLKTLARPQVWAVTGIHTTAITVLFGLVLYAFAVLGVAGMSGLDIRSLAVIAFALSFSSTVFVVKALEEKGAIRSLHGRIAIGVLIMQDIMAVVFLAMSAGKMPSVFALALFLLIPLRPVLHKVLSHMGHGELMVLYGFILALGGAEVFELVGMKGDLGALALGILIAPHARSEEMAKMMLGFKDLFLLGFFLSIGLSGKLTEQTMLTAIILTSLVIIKSAAFFALFTAFKLRARTALMATLNLSNFSEFGLIVMAVGVSNGWVGSEWLISIAVAMALSFVIAAILNTGPDILYSRFRDKLDKFQRAERLPDDHTLNIGDAEVAVIGMGGVGLSAYDEMRRQYGDKVIGIDIDPITARNHQAEGRNVLWGDPSDPDFWLRVQSGHTLQLVMLALPQIQTALAVIKQIENASFDGQIAATSKFPDETELLKQHGVNIVFDVYREAGTGFATHVFEHKAGDDSQSLAGN